MTQVISRHVKTQRPNTCIVWPPCWNFLFYILNFTVFILFSLFLANNDKKKKEKNIYTHNPPPMSLVIIVWTDSITQLAAEQNPKFMTRCSGRVSVICSFKGTRQTQTKDQPPKIEKELERKNKSAPASISEYLYFWLR